MRKWMIFTIALILLLSSCSQKNALTTDEDRISFLAGYGVKVDIERPYYSTDTVVPEIFDACWTIRDIFSRDLLGKGLEDHKMHECKIYMYPVLKLPFDTKGENDAEPRAVVVSSGGHIICSHIEFISALRSYPSMSLKGKSLVDLSKVSWDTWKERIDSDDDKRFIIWQYYSALRSGDYEEAYWYIYDKDNIKKEDFIKAARENTIFYIDFLDIRQYKSPEGDECYFMVDAMVTGSDNKKKKKYEIIFDLKKDPKEKKYSGWKIYRTKIR